MNSVILLIPLFAIRYGLLSIINKGALPRAAHFPPMQGIEKIMNGIYQTTTILIVLLMFFLKINTELVYFIFGIVVYMGGLLLLILSNISFAKPDEDGINKSGLYRISRNPMYVAYFIYFVGCVVLTQSVQLLFLLCVFQISAHWIILSEERWCVEKFGQQYLQYMKKVRRYI